VKCQRRQEFVIVGFTDPAGPGMGWAPPLKSPCRCPDRITLDLDPDPDLSWKKVIEGAQLTKTLLDSLGLVSFVKTTGGKGFQLKQ